MLASHVLQHLLASEKAIHLEKAQRYVFVVSRQANKIQVKHAFQELYGIVPAAVNMTYLPEKHRSRDGARKRQVQKKAVITLPVGAKVNIQQVKDYHAKVK